MCRLLGMVAARPMDTLGALLEGRRSLLAQSMCNPKRAQGDGWGIGHWTGRGWSVIKRPGAVFNEKERFREAATHAVSSIVLAHVRRASNPLNLPRSRLLSFENSQPFGEGRYLFIHNGVVTIPQQVAATLGSYRKRIRGINDSEVLFWLVMRNLKLTGGIPEAFSKSVDDLWTVWDRLGDAAREKAGKQFGRSAPYYGLNCFISDGKALHAFCKHDGASPKPALCGGKQPFFQLCHATRGNATLVASERTDSSTDWEFMPDRTVLSVRAAEPRKWAVVDL